MTAEPLQLVLKPWLAAVLSLVIPGLGEAYCGRRRMGLAIVVASMLTLYLCGLAPIASAINAWFLAKRVKVRLIQPVRQRDANLADVAEDLFD